MGQKIRSVLGVLLSILLILSSLGSTLIEEVTASGSNDHEYCIETAYCDGCTDSEECTDGDHHDHDVALSEHQMFKDHIVSSSSTSSVTASRAACNHSYQLTQVEAPTCTKAGKKAYVCTKCKAWKPNASTVSISALGHSYQQQTTKQPTCGTAGTYVTKCTRCGAGSPTGNGSIPATGRHNWSLSGTTNATCTADGKRTYRCSGCGQTKTETISRLGHNMQQVTTKQPTCGTGGTYETKCTRCGAGSPTGNGTIPATGKHTYNVSAANCTTAKKCTVCGYVAQAALGHSMQQVTTKQPTCGTGGTYVTKCSRCGAGSPNGNGEIPATGKHTYNVTEANCTTAKKCTVCGYVAQAALGHNWDRSAATCTADKKCTRCGTVGAKATGHTYNVSAADCTTAKKCTKCGYVAQAALGHSMQQVTTKQPTCGTGGTYVTKCSRCGIGSPNGNGEIPATGKHTYNIENATCTTAKKCTVCGYVAQKALGHDYRQVTTKEPTCGTGGTYESKCSRCGIGSPTGNGEIPATGRHTYNIENATCTKDKKCTVCGYIAEKAGHDWNRSEASCTEDKKCKRCGTVGEKATGHTFNVSAATCTTSKKCTKCGYVEKAALGHAYRQVTTKEPTCGTGGTYETKCSRCGIGSPTGNGEIPATGKHTCNIAEATCTKDKVCTTCGKIIEKAPGHDGEWITTLEPSCKGSGKEEYICKVCGVVINGRSIQYYGEHNWNERDVATCTHRCKDCGFVEECHRFHKEERSGSKPCTIGIVYVCDDCKKEVIRNPKHTGDVHGFPVSRIEGDDCEFAIVWRRCPYCNEEFRDDIRGTAHTFVKGTCIYCKAFESWHDDNEAVKAVILTGIGHDSANTASLQRVQQAIAYHFNNEYNSDQIQELSQNDQKSTILNYLDEARFFAYCGHGDTDTSLAVYNVDGIYRSDISGMDLANLDIVCLIDCYSAGNCSVPKNNTTYMIPSESKTSDYVQYEQYRNSLAYQFCESGAMFCVGCNVAMDAVVADYWYKAFTPEYIRIVNEFDEEYSNQDWSIETKREVFRNEYLYPLVVQTSVDALDACYDDDADYDMWLNSFMFFQREHDNETGEEIITVTNLDLMAGDLERNAVSRNGR